MFLKNKKDENIVINLDSSTNVESNNKIRPVIINNKLYDITKATKIFEGTLFKLDMPEYFDTIYAFTIVSIYKGNTEWFCLVCGLIVVVDEEWVKKVLGQYDVEKYIEVFGEPELA